MTTDKELLVLEGQKGMDGLSDGRDIRLKLTSDKKNEASHLLY